MSEIIAQSQDPDALKKILNTELRHLDASKLTKLSIIIDRAQSLDRLLVELTESRARYIDGKPLAVLKISIEAINTIKQQSLCGKSPAYALLNYWAISGRRRPTIKGLLVYLNISNLKWAEEYICKSVLGVDSIEDILLNNKPASSGEATVFHVEDDFKFDNLTDLIDNIQMDCARFNFESIYKSTNRFCHKPLTGCGHKIGEGRFSSVYRATTFIESQPSGAPQIVAAKLLRSACNKKYLANEINLVYNISHDNILKLLGLSLGQASAREPVSYVCLIYPFMENGSLLDCLAQGLTSRQQTHLSCLERFDIAIKVARGISHLHSLKEGAIIHRDIKSANIFIDSLLEPKVGDFTLVRQLAPKTTTSGHRMASCETQFSQNIIGTSVYMPPEAFRGDISVKFDSFSYGVVVLELLTGLKPFNELHDEDLLTHVNERLSDLADESEPTTALSKQINHNNTADSVNRLSAGDNARDRFISSLLDERAGEWYFSGARMLFNVALQATEARKSIRPRMADLLQLIESAGLPSASKKPGQVA